MSLEDETADEGDEVQSGLEGEGDDDGVDEENEGEVPEEILAIP